MSQYYPQQSPLYPPERPPEEDYYDEDEYEYIDDDDYGDSDNSLVQYALAFFAGGCLIFLCMSCCFLLAGGLWTLGDALVSSPTIPGSDLGLSYDDPAYPGDPVINEQKVRLIVGDVYPNAASMTPLPEGQELIIVTIDLENLNPDQDVSYSEKDFLLLNSPNSGYEPIAGQDSLGRGRLRAEAGTAGQLLFQVTAGERDLILAWENLDGGARYILLQ